MIDDKSTGNRVGAAPPDGPLISPFRAPSREEDPQMPDYIPNVRLRAWRNEKHLSRWQMAEQINATPVGVAERLACDEERVRRWEAGEVRWPRTPYRLALTQLTGLEPEALGFSQDRQTGSRLIEARVMPTDALRAEADLYGTMELAQQLQASDVGTGTLEALAEAVDLLCRAR